MSFQNINVAMLQVNILVYRSIKIASFEPSAAENAA